MSRKHDAAWQSVCGLTFCVRARSPPALQAHYRDYGKMTYARCVFVIHNMAHQGRGPFDETRYLELNDHYKEMFRCAPLGAKGRGGAWLSWGAQRPL